MPLEDKFERFLSLDAQFYGTLRQLMEAAPERQEELVLKLEQIADEIESFMNDAFENKVTLLADLNRQRWH